MRYLIKQGFKVNDQVKFKKHPFDNSVYKVTQAFDDNTYFIDNYAQEYKI